VKVEINTNPRVIIVTDFGTIEVEIAEKVAPITAANFLGYVKDGAFDGSIFYRTVLMDNQPDNDVKIEVIQGGLGLDKIGNQRKPSIQQETTNITGLNHQDGTISMARLAPDSATSEFFICINDQPELDFGGKRNPDGQGFAAFGWVTSGMEVVRQIQSQLHEGQSLTPPVAIHAIKRIS
jgi:peptidyl-prolyl cis-trans isomerase A (cyclophilin A)